MNICTPPFILYSVDDELYIRGHANGMHLTGVEVQQRTVERCFQLMWDIANSDKLKLYEVMRESVIFLFLLFVCYCILFYPPFCYFFLLLMLSYLCFCYFLFFLVTLKEGPINLSGKSKRVQLMVWRSRGFLFCERVGRKEGIVCMGVVDLGSFGLAL